MVPRDKCSLAHVEVKMGSVFIQFDWPFMEGRREEKKGVHACMGGCTCWETVRVCVDNRVHDILPTQVHPV